MKTKKRFDCILIWGHGLQYFDKIIADIRSNEYFNIVKIQKHIPKSLNKFVREMYSYDYAPYWHLKSKTNYLLKSPKTVCFIFIENLMPNEDFLGEGSFRHKESITLKVFKEELRDKYNPYRNGERSHDHVIHATDSQEQASHMLEYLGYDDGIDLFTSSQEIIKAPYHIKNLEILNIKNINTDDILCNVVVGNSWKDFSYQARSIVDTPQYIGLTQDMSIYEAYIKKFSGGPLQDDYNLDKYAKLSDDFDYLKPPYENSYVIVQELEKGKFLVLDGVHRLCNHILKGNKKVKVCQITNQER